MSIEKDMQTILDFRYRCLPFHGETAKISKASLNLNLTKINIRIEELSHLKTKTNKEQHNSNKQKFYKDIEYVDYIAHYFYGFAYDSFKILLSEPREILQRKYISTPVNKIRDPLGSRALNKIIKSSGKDIRDKMINAKTVEISKSVYTVNSLENQALKDCTKRLLSIMKDDINLEVPYKKLRKLFKRSSVSTCSSMRTLEPNSKLLHDPNYRKIWMVRGWLIHLEKIKQKDKNSKDALVVRTFFLVLLARLKEKYKLIIPECYYDFTAFVESEKELEYSENLLYIAYNKEYKNIPIAIKENKITLNNKKITTAELEEIFSLKTNFKFNLEKIDQFIESCDISIAKYESFTTQKQKNLFPYICMPQQDGKQDIFIKYNHKGIELTPDYPFAVKDIDDIESVNMVSDSQKKHRILFDTLKNPNDFVQFRADSLEPDEYAEVGKNSLPMCIAVGLAKGLLDNPNSLGKSFTILDTFSEKCTETTIKIQEDKETKEKYFLRKIPKEIEEKDLMSFGVLLQKLTAKLKDDKGKMLNELLKSQKNQNAFVEYLLINKVAYLYDKEQWYVFLSDELIEDIEEFKANVKKYVTDNLLLTHSLMGITNNAYHLLDKGAEEYKNKKEKGAIVWKEEIISLDMYQPVTSEKRIMRVSLVDKDKNIEPKWNEAQKVATGSKKFTLPKGNESSLNLLFNNETIKSIYLKYPYELENDLLTDLEAEYTYGKQQPYSLVFKNKDENFSVTVNIDEVKENAEEDYVDKKSTPQLTPLTLRSFNKKYPIPKAFAPSTKLALNNRGSHEMESFIKEAIGKENIQNLCLCLGKIEEPKKSEIAENLNHIIKLKEDNLRNRINMRYLISHSTSSLDKFIKMLFSINNNDRKNLHNHLWTLSYASWYNEETIKTIFDKRNKDKTFNKQDPVDNINEFIKKLIIGLDIITDRLNEEIETSNYSTLLFLALLRLRKSNNKEIRKAISLKNPIIQKFLFKLYDFDWNVRELKNKTKIKKKNGKEQEVYFLYTDGFKISTDNQEEELSNMQEHIYLIHKHLTDENPPAISVTIN